jgi:glycerol-3-phosphate dehydrogenase (NAD(P)+)
VIQGLPCATTIAFKEDEARNKSASWFQGGPLLVETSCDVEGVQVAGALKNVMAIGYGLLQQAQVGENALATYLTKAIQEIRTVIQAWGGRQETVLTSAGIGDLIVTCCSPYSRNSDFGRLFPSQSTQLVEGQYTLKGIFKKTDASNIPLIKGIYEVISGIIPLSDWVAKVLTDTFPQHVMFT